MSKCNTTMFADPLTRTCVDKCNPVLGLFGDVIPTIPICTALCTSGTFADPFTQTCKSACNTSPQMYGFDNGLTTGTIRACVYSCPYPYVADNSTLKCRMQCNNASYPYIDQASQSCVAICSAPVYQYSYMPQGSVVNG
jgi:hypothetical protein